MVGDGDIQKFVREREGNKMEGRTEGEEGGGFGLGRSIRRGKMERNMGGRGGEGDEKAVLL